MVRQRQLVVALVVALVELGCPSDCSSDFVQSDYPNHLRQELVVAAVVAVVVVAEQMDLVVVSNRLAEHPRDYFQLASEPVVEQEVVEAVRPIHLHPHRCQASPAVQLVLEPDPKVKLVAVVPPLQQQLLAVAGALESKHPTD